MKGRILTSVLLTGCFLICAAIATDLSGKWSSTFKTPDGTTFPLSYVFKVDGTKLTGTVTSPQGELAIADGTTDGAAFSFSVNVGGTVIKNTGKYYAAADSAGIDIDFGGAKMHGKLTRPQ